MDEVCINIKTELQSDHNGLTALAQLVAIYTSAGIISATEIAAKTGYSERGVRKAMTELRCRNQSATEPECRNPGAESGTPVPSRNQGAGTPVPKPEALVCADNTTRATNELPTEVSSYLEDIITPLVPQAVFETVELVTPSVEIAVVAKPPSRQRGTRLPDAWELPADWRVWAQTNFPFAPETQIDDQAAQFHDYWIAKPGAQAAKLNWEATWRNWCRKGLSAAGKVRQPQYTGVYSKGGEPMESASAAMARMMAEGAFQ